MMQKLRSHSLNFLLPMLVLAAVLFPRIALLGGTPHTDEGFYIYNAMVIHASFAAGHGLPYDGMLLLYPALLSWIVNFDGNLFFAFRFADMLVTCAAGLCLYRLLAQESRSHIAGALLAAAFMFTLNLGPFIMSGFRNALFPAYIPLLLALTIALREREKSTREWMLCGTLVALTVLLRENLAIFAIYGAFCLFLWKGRKPALHFCIGGAVTAMAIIAIDVALRGGVVGIMNAYIEMSALNEGPFSGRWIRFAKLSLHAAYLSRGALLITAVCVVIPFLRACVKRRFAMPHLWRFLFWLGLALIPLVEPLTKIGTTYHYSTCLIGLAGLSAFGWRNYGVFAPWFRILAGITLVIIFIIANNSNQKSMKRIWKKDSRPNLELWQEKHWSETAVSSNNYLYLADLVSDAMPASGGYLSTGYQAYPVYPVTGFLPSSHALSNLTIAVMNLGEERLVEELRKCLPAVLMITDKSYKPNEKLFHALDNMEEYELAKFIPTSNRRVGAYNGYLYMLKEGTPPCLPEENP